MPAPRGIRNHNPLNLRRDGTKWQGLAPTQNDAEFFQFLSAVWGIRAAARVLVTYKDKWRIKRLRTVINRWAPPIGQRQDGETYTQDSDAYLAHVVRQTGFEPDQNLDLTDYAHVRPLIEAMIRHENGRQPYSAEEIDQGLAMAGILPARPSKLPTPEAKAGAVAAGGAAAAGGASLINEATPAIPLLTTLASHLPAVVLSLVVIGGAWVAWTYWRRSRRGKA